MPKADLRTLVTFSICRCVFACFIFAWLFEPMYFELQMVTTLGLLWTVLVLSIGAIMLMLYMMRQGSVAKTSALLYLICRLWLRFKLIFLFGEKKLP